MASGNVTQPTDESAEAWVDALKDPRRREEARTLLALFARVTGQPPVLCGPSIIGFGRYHYRYESGREGEFMMTGFAPRKANLVVYVMPGFDDFADLLAALGSPRTGRSCLYLRRLDGVDLAALERLVAAGYGEMLRRHGPP